MKRAQKKEKRTVIYLKVTPEKNEIIYSGIDFSEFIESLVYPIENILVISSGCVSISHESRSERSYELFEGYDLVKSLGSKNLYNYGNFCFVDFASSCKISEISDEQDAELLFLGSRFRPLNTPFFENLQNRFAYLAHDDGFFCKLYCRDSNDFSSVLYKKISSAVKDPVSISSKNFVNRILQLAAEGIVVDLNEIIRKDGYNEITIYTIGEHLDIDKVHNNLREIKKNALQTNTIMI